jgi:hypothetical protein
MIQLILMDDSKIKALKELYNSLKESYEISRYEWTLASKNCHNHKKVYLCTCGSLWAKTLAIWDQVLATQWEISLLTKKIRKPAKYLWIDRLLEE